MNWTKQSCLEINDLKQKVITASKSSLSNMLILADKPVNGSIKYAIKTCVSELKIAVEAKIDVNITIKLDGCILEKSEGSYITASDAVLSGEHNLEILTGECVETLKTTIIAEDISQSVKKYELTGTDTVNKKIYLKEGNLLFSLSLASENPYLAEEALYDSICTIDYSDNSISLSATAYIENGVLKVNDNSIITVITEGVTAAAMVKAVCNSYHYHLIYVKNNILYLIVKTSTGFGFSEILGDEEIDKVVGTGGRILLYRTTAGKWNALEVSESESSIIFTKEVLNVRDMPSIYESGIEIVYFVKHNGKYCALNNEELIPYCSADLLAYLGGYEVMIWNYKIRIKKPEE